MNKIINYLKNISLFFIVLFIYLLLMSIIYYFELFSYKTINIINYIFMILLFFLLGFKTAYKEQRKGYLNGFLVSLVLIIVFFIITLFLTKIGFSNIVYYMSLILSSVIGGIVGVKEKNNYIKTLKKSLN